jgi:CHAD domain-containing protein
MSYEFMSDEPLAQGVRRIVREEVAAATEKLKVKKVVERDLAIHEVRKSVKRVRGLLKLMQPALGEAYSREASDWRDLGRRLSSLRDAGVTLEVFDELRPSCPKRLYGPIRHRLSGAIREVSPDVDRILARVALGLKRAEMRLKAWPLEGEGFSAVGPGFQLTYRRGLRALRAAQTDPSSENLHELRKRAKEHLFQVRLLRELWDDKLRRHEASARRLEETLGSHQNLAVLKTKILERPKGVGNPEDVESFLAVLDRTEGDLAEKALRLGERVYRERPAQWEKRVKRLWNRWADL